MRPNMRELLRARMQEPAEGGDEADPIARARSSRRRAIVAFASLGIHGALVWLAISIPASAVMDEPRSAHVSMIDVDIGVSPPPPREGRQRLASVSRSGAPGTPARAHANERAGLRGRRGHSAAPLVSAPPTNDPFAELSIKYDGVDREALRPGAGTGDDGTGRGAGARGDGRGLGIDAPLGLGTGGLLRVPPPPPSQARPPRAKYDYRRWAFRAPQEYGGEKLLLELEIDASGRVTVVRVLESVDRQVDARAVEVVRRFEFHPALDDAGRPIAGAHRWEFVIEGVVEFGAGLGHARWTEQRAGVTRSPP